MMSYCIGIVASSTHIEKEKSPRTEVTLLSPRSSLCSVSDDEEEKFTFNPNAPKKFLKKRHSSRCSNACDVFNDSHDTLLNESLSQAIKERNDWFYKQGIAMGISTTCLFGSMFTMLYCGANQDICTDQTRNAAFYTSMVSLVGSMFFRP